MIDLRILSFCTVLALTVTSALAQETSLTFGEGASDPTLPVEVTSETLDVNQEDGSAEFKGNVVVIQGDMRLSADRVLVIYNEEKSAIERVEATGDVVLVSGPDEAEADKADYTIESGVIVLTGNALLNQGPNTISSDKVTVNLATGTAQMVGRVKTILKTEQN